VPGRRGFGSGGRGRGVGDCSKAGGRAQSGAAVRAPGKTLGRKVRGARRERRLGQRPDAPRRSLDLRPTSFVQETLRATRGAPNGRAAERKGRSARCRGGSTPVHPAERLRGSPTALP